MAISQLPHDLSFDSLFLKFGIGQVGNAHLYSGWGEPEEGFVWSEGTFASLKLPRKPRVTTLLMSLWGYAPIANTAQECLIFLDGRLLGFKSISDREMVVFDFEPIHAGPEITLDLYLPKARSPQDFDGGNDSRCLGIALATLELRSSQDV